MKTSRKKKVVSTVSGIQHRPGRYYEWAGSPQVTIDGVLSYPGPERSKERFREAVDYAKSAIRNGDTKAFYAKLAGPKQSAYNVAIADFLTPPQVLGVSMHYNPTDGGQVFYVEAKDICHVFGVHLEFTDANSGKVLFSEFAKHEEHTWWSLKIPGKFLKPNMLLMIDVLDAPGNLTTCQCTLVFAPSHLKSPWAVNPQHTGRRLLPVSKSKKSNP